MYLLYYVAITTNYNYQHHICMCHLKQIHSWVPTNIALPLVPKRVFDKDCVNKIKMYQLFEKTASGQKKIEL